MCFKLHFGWHLEEQDRSLTHYLLSRLEIAMAPELPCWVPGLRPAASSARVDTAPGVVLLPRLLKLLSSGRDSY